MHACTLGDGKRRHDRGAWARELRGSRKTWKDTERECLCSVIIRVIPWIDVLVRRHLGPVMLHRPLVPRLRTQRMQRKGNRFRVRVPSPSLSLTPCLPCRPHLHDRLFESIPGKGKSSSVEKDSKTPSRGNTLEGAKAASGDLCGSSPRAQAFWSGCFSLGGLSQPPLVPRSRMPRPVFAPHSQYLAIQGVGLRKRRGPRIFPLMAS